MSHAPEVRVDARHLAEYRRLLEREIARLEDLRRVAAISRRARIERRLRTARIALEALNKSFAALSDS